MRLTLIILLVFASSTTAFNGLTLSTVPHNAPALFKPSNISPVHTIVGLSLTPRRGAGAVPTTRSAVQALSHSATTEYLSALDEECDISQPSLCASSNVPLWVDRMNELQERGLGSIFLLAATALSLTLANTAKTSARWLSFWSSPFGPAIGGHALSPQGWVNEGLMALFFFVVGLEIKLELRRGSLSSVRKAVLPCIAAVGGMIVPMLVYLATTTFMGGGSLAALTVPMATDIAFAMAIFGFFRSRMPVSSSTFLLTLATVDDLGAIIVLATCFAQNITPSFLGGALLITAGLGQLGRRKSRNLKAYSAGGAALWWCLLRAGVSADVAGVLVAMCISTNAVVGDELSSVDGPEDDEENPFLPPPELLNERLITLLSPVATFFIMPAFALANTAVPLSGAIFVGLGGTALAPAAGVGMGLLLGKPLGIFGSTWLATKAGAQLPPMMSKRHLGVVSILGAIGFTMCLLLTDVAMPVALQPIPKLAILLSSAIASLVGASAMLCIKPKTA